MISTRFFIYIIAVLVVFLSYTGSCYAERKAVIIYVSGILATDPVDFEKDIRKLHKQFANKKLGKYTISPEFKIVNWGDISRKGLTYDLFKSGLIKINTENNKSKVKATSETKPGLLLNPVNRFLLLGDSGSSSNAVFWRNYVHNHLYDIVWYFLNEDNKMQIFSDIRDKIVESDDYYILFGNSFGAVIVLDYVISNIIPNNSDTQRFLGLITTADANNTVFAPVWSSNINSNKYDLKRKEFQNYFLNNDKFWISYNHRSDIIASGISPDITVSNNKGGFIASKINKARPIYNFINAYKLWNRNDGLINSHNWCFHKPKDFVNSVLNLYNENSCLILNQSSPNGAK